ncbi:hypothetical protein EDEG_01914 [Edhazardia aedis USNM 41457]|uniref:Uncharacterized protein n=1 Tax=Edhazardia aedis (strain USNM 41457) TaxID=1003232 RepID=J9DMG0_EDHAE|nr:hypothetical protein EDEG_01914 [Edhazardia aedis USNM 41457]|eukprot:EJW03785.1 hypothetical protein EDEG_01914 [Edhazardia aedis USNM 41457]
MEEIDKLVHLRKKHGFYQQDYVTYLQFLKTVRKESTIYQAEKYLVKSMQNTSKKRYARKCLKRAIKVADNKLYKEYLNCFLLLDCGNSSGNGNIDSSKTSVLASLLEIRGKVEDNFILVDEIDQIISKINKEKVPAKIEHNWNGIILNFNCKGELDSFLNLKLSSKVDYQADLQNSIVRLIIAENSFKRALKKYYNFSIKYSGNQVRKNILINNNDKDVENVKLDINKAQETSNNKNENKKFNPAILKKKIFTKILKFSLDLIEASKNLFLILEKNFIKNKYIQKIQKNYAEFNNILEKLEKYNNAQLFDETVFENYEIPVEMNDISTEIRFLINSRCIDRHAALSIYLQNVLSDFKTGESLLKIPFLPVFYDSAYDFIIYPDIDNMWE